MAKFVVFDRPNTKNKYLINADLVTYVSEVGENSRIHFSEESDVVVVGGLLDTFAVLTD